MRAIICRCLSAQWCRKPDVVDREPLIVLMPSDHRLTAREAVRPQDFVGEIFSGGLQQVERLADSQAVPVAARRTGGAEPEALTHTRLWRQADQLGGLPAYLPKKFARRVDFTKPRSTCR
jgi:hypothetical protein